METIECALDFDGVLKLGGSVLGELATGLWPVFLSTGMKYLLMPRDSMLNICF